MSDAQQEIEKRLNVERLRAVLAPDFGGDPLAGVLAWAAEVCENEATQYDDGSTMRVTMLEQSATFWTGFVYRIAEVEGFDQDDVDAVGGAVIGRHLVAVPDA